MARAPHTPRRRIRGVTAMLWRALLTLALALGVSGRWRVEAEAEAEPVAERGADADAEAHSRPDPRAPRRREGHALLPADRGVAIFSTPLRISPTVPAPDVRRPPIPRRIAPDDDHAHAIG